MTTERDSLSPSARFRSLLETEGHDPERLFARLRGRRLAPAVTDRVWIGVSRATAPPRPVRFRSALGLAASLLLAVGLALVLQPPTGGPPAVLTLEAGPEGTRPALAARPPIVEWPAETAGRTLALDLDGVAFTLLIDPDLPAL